MENCSGVTMLYYKTTNEGCFKRDALVTELNNVVYKINIELSDLNLSQLKIICCVYFLLYLYLQQHIYISITYI